MSGAKTVGQNVRFLSNLCWARPYFTLIEGVTLHVYTSSASCGNATVKKFATMSKERYRDDLGPDEWPMEGHKPVPGHSWRLGQFALLLKRDAIFVPSDDGKGVGVRVVYRTGTLAGRFKRTWEGLRQCTVSRRRRG